MHARALIAAAIAGAITLAGCGGSSHSSSNSATTIAANPPPSLHPLAQRLLQPGDLPGFAPRGARVAAFNAASWVQDARLSPSERNEAIASLEHLGFARGARERLYPTHGGPVESVSLVEQFKSTSGATEELELAKQAAKARGAAVVELNEAHIPGAWVLGTASGGTIDVNVVFTDATYYYRVAVTYPKGTPGAPSIVPLTLAAERLYRREHAEK
jgi:hypothetical protein